MRIARGAKKTDAAKRLFYSATVLALLITIIAPLMYLFGYPISLNTADLVSTVSLSFFLGTAAVSWMLYKRVPVRKITDKLGLSRDRLTRKNIGYGILIFIAYLALILAIGVFSSITGISVNSNASSVLGLFPLWLLPFVMIIAPLNEEILFRGFLVPRIGIVVSALFFAILHGGYASYVEFFMALWFGLVAGYAFKRTKSLYPSLVTHILVNTTTALALFGSGAIGLVHIL